MAGAGGVPEALVGALRAVLDDAGLDGAFVAAAISLPSASELIDDIPGVDPIVLHDVRRAKPGVMKGSASIVGARVPSAVASKTPAKTLLFCFSRSDHEALVCATAGSMWRGNSQSSCALSWRRPSSARTLRPARPTPPTPPRCALRHTAWLWLHQACNSGLQGVVMRTDVTLGGSNPTPQLHLCTPVTCWGVAGSPQICHSAFD